MIAFLDQAKMSVIAKDNKYLTYIARGGSFGTKIETNDWVCKSQLPSPYFSSSASSSDGIL